MPAAVALLPHPRTHALTFAVTKAIADYFAGLMKQLRESEVTADVFERGDRLTVTSPFDRSRQLASVGATNPDPEAVVTDRAAFSAWMLEHHEDRCDVVESIIPGRERDVIEALRKHLTVEELAVLVTEDKRPAAHEENAVLKRSAAAGQVVGPGGEIDDDAPVGVTVRPKKSVVQVTLAEGAVDHILELWRGGHVDLPAALPAGD